ncbi:LON peptidase substrate-binding domain-containing protein [Endozoicomonas sp. G2_2]|uniref:LON peptidase substrate-binding domain-containing protein n=1 Tax=Endozoicomonas sp. G2_2 TaxID=2821092 RepID=UPI001ADACFB4|nr:LON peptidase substrate-binding domain-containing protein [Endozoicomonas sp. G2_2]MBO9469946.1 LON peptidase substrate-binding domain-containing protein [Endozoicomonas sp. G2_2]
MDHPDYPLFPLTTVIFPGGIMPLRIFEPRYLDMVSMCMKGQTGFGVCAARPAEKDHEFSSPRAVGTLVEIVDFDRLDDGTLGITVEGRRRFDVVSTRQADNGLWWGEVDFIREDADSACPIEFSQLKQVAAALIEEIGLPYEQRGTAYDSASWLSARLTELLPFDAATKHDLLATNDPLERLRRIRPMVEIENTG